MWDIVPHCVYTPHTHFDLFRFVDGKNPHEHIRM